MLNGGTKCNFSCALAKAGEGIVEFTEKMTETVFADGGIMLDENLLKLFMSSIPQKEIELKPL